MSKSEGFTVILFYPIQSYLKASVNYGTFDMTCQLIPTLDQIQQAGQCLYTLYKFDAVGSYPLT